MTSSNGITFQQVTPQQPRDTEHAPTRPRASHHGESQTIRPEIDSQYFPVIYLTSRPKQPPKRKSGGTAESGASGKAARQSKLAKEHDITAQEEAEIKEAFSLFAEPMDGEKEGVIPIDDVRRAMMYVCCYFLLPRPFTFAHLQRDPSRAGSGGWIWPEGGTAC